VNGWLRHPASVQATATMLMVGTLAAGAQLMLRMCSRRPPRSAPGRGRPAQPSRDLRHFATDGADPGRELPLDRYEALPDR